MVAEHTQDRATGGTNLPGGAVGLTVIRRGGWVPDRVRALIAEFNPRTELGRLIKGILPLVSPEQAEELIAAISRSVIMESSLSLTVFRPFDRIARIMFGENPDPAFMRRHHGDLYAVEELGIVSRRVVTTAGVGFLVDAWQNILELELMKFHGIGTGGTAEATGDTALVTELTTQYNPDSTRATGTLAEGAGANVFRSVGTNTVDAAAAITEHGLFSQAATGGGVLWDRSLFSVVNLASGDSLQSTYDATMTAGG